LDAKRAYELGFLNRLVEKDEVENEAYKFAESICQNAPVSVRRTKDLFYKSWEMNKSQSLDRAYIISEQLRKMEDCKEGVQAFKEKRKPQWKER